MNVNKLNSLDTKRSDFGYLHAYRTLIVMLKQRKYSRYFHPEA
jgi:hypothetical protein